jgi:uroporphyrin-3 C-methyltransferase
MADDDKRNAASTGSNGEDHPDPSADGNDSDVQSDEQPGVRSDAQPDAQNTDGGAGEQSATGHSRQADDVAPPALSSGPPADVARATPRKNVTGGLALLLALVAIGLAGYPSYQAYTGSLNQSVATSMDASGRAELDSLRQELETQSARVTDLSRRFTQTGTTPQRVSDEAVAGLTEQLMASRQELDQQLRTVRSDFDAEMSGLAATVAATQRELADRRTTRSQDWLLAEVEYLVRMANQRNLMDEDPLGAISLLRAADEIIANAEELTAHPLRQAIANDIVSLSSVEHIDVEGIYLSLSAQIGAVPELPRRLPKYMPPTTQPTPVGEMNGARESTGILDAIGSVLVRFGRSLSGLIDFRKNVPGVDPILPPKEEYYLRQNLILKLQLAQLGLLQQRRQVYSVSIDEAIAWVDRYFDVEHSATKAMQTTLTELQGVDVVRDLPAISASLREARKLLADFEKAPPS